MKMIKLSEEQYTVVDDSEIKEGDWYYDTNDKESLMPIYQRSQNPKFYSGCKKITHSTKPLEDVGLNTSMGCQLGFDKIEPLYLSEVKELFGVVDVEKKAQIEWGNVHRTGVLGYIDGYNQAIEDNKERKYTEEDVIKMIEKSRTTGLTAEYLILAHQPKTEWEVEFVDGKLKLK